MGKGFIVDWKGRFKGKKILLVEDDEISREMMMDILGLMDCQVEFAIDGNDAVAKYQKGSFDLILMDIQMPNKDGLMASREIRVLEKEEKRTPIIALTASRQAQEFDELVKAGIDDCVEKPINLENLSNKMAKFLLGRS